MQRTTVRPIFTPPEKGALTFSAHTAPVLPNTGFLRLPQIIGRPATKTAPPIPALIPVSKSTWWAGVKALRYPQPTRALGARITAWAVEDIRALIEATAPVSAQP